MTSPVDTAADFLVDRHTRAVLDLDTEQTVPDVIGHSEAFLVAIRLDRYAGPRYSIADQIEVLDTSIVRIADLVALTTAALAGLPAPKGLV